MGYLDFYDSFEELYSDRGHLLAVELECCYSADFLVSCAKTKNKSCIVVLDSPTNNPDNKVTNSALISLIKHEFNHLVYYGKLSYDPENKVITIRQTGRYEGEKSNS